MVWDLINFTMIGLLLGVAVRFLVGTNRNRPAVPLMVTVVPSIAGAMLGGIVSWRLWPADNGQFHFGGVFAAIVGSAAAILCAIAVLRYRGSIG